jgi:hypothetical protein
MKEPLIHSHITDGLPDGHPLLASSEDEDGVFCCKCKAMVHDHGANETMQTWVETGKGNYCWGCFLSLGPHEVLSDDYALPD